MARRNLLSCAPFSCRDAVHHVSICNWQTDTSAAPDTTHLQPGALAFTRSPGRHRLDRRQAQPIRTSKDKPGPGRCGTDGGPMRAGHDVPDIRGDRLHVYRTLRLALRRAAKRHLPDDRWPLIANSNNRCHSANPWNDIQEIHTRLPGHPNTPNYHRIQRLLAPLPTNCGVSNRTVRPPRNEPGRMSRKK
jgi:hypothetical protein